MGGPGSRDKVPQLVTDRLAGDQWYRTYPVHHWPVVVKHPACQLWMLNQPWFGFTAYVVQLTPVQFGPHVVLVYPTPQTQASTLTSFSGQD
jgi:hypothetical protein